MAKIKPKDKKGRKKKLHVDCVIPEPSKFHISPKVLLAQAAELLQLGEIEAALPLAKQALESVEVGSVKSLPAINLCGEIFIELGEIDSAREYFRQAAAIDEHGTIEEENGGGPEKFLWLAQLSEEGGNDSVYWFEKGAKILRHQIQTLLERGSITEKDESQKAELREKTKRLACTLCSMVEVYMTDLSWEENAEQRCETLITEATMVAPSFAEPWQTLANVRLSQQRLDDARAALKRSLDLWRDLPSQDPSVPDYPTRVSLSRLLMEAGMDTEAIEVLERLVAEDDSSVEVWYLGGWGLYVLGEKQLNSESKNDKEDKEMDQKTAWISSRQWLKQAIALFELQSYEDEKLGEHAREILEILNKKLGVEAADEVECDDGWSDVEESEEDEVMVDS